MYNIQSCQGHEWPTKAHGDIQFITATKTTTYNLGNVIATIKDISLVKIIHSIECSSKFYMNRLYPQLGLDQ